MKNTFTAVVKQDGDWWVGWIEEIPGVNCQEATREELLESLRITLGEALEFDRQDVVSVIGDDYEEIPCRVKRRNLIGYLHLHGCELLREGANHSWRHNPAQNRRSAVPRHTKVRDNLRIWAFRP